MIVESYFKYGRKNGYGSFCILKMSVVFGVGYGAVFFLATMQKRVSVL